MYLGQQSWSTPAAAGKGKFANNNNNSNIKGGGKGKGNAQNFQSGKAAGKAQGKPMYVKPNNPTTLSTGAAKGGWNAKGVGKQQQQQQQPRQVVATKPAPTGEVGKNAKRLKVTGCTHNVVGPIVRGSYVLDGSNHGKPSFRKDPIGADGLTVIIYFWDERDGAAASGWWIGPSIGGNMVWGHHPNRSSATPPCGGWQAPHSSPVDPTMVLTVVDTPEDQQKKIEAAKARQEEVRKEREVKQAEAAAVATIRKDIRKLQGVTPETLEKLLEDLTVTMGTEFMNCGSLQSTVQEEHDKAVAAAKEKAKNVETQREKFAQQKEEFAKKKEEEREEALKLLNEFSEKVTAAQSASESFSTEFKEFQTRSDITSEEAAKEACAEVEEKLKKASEEVAALISFLKTNTSKMKSVPVKPAESKKEGEETSDSTPNFFQLSKTANGLKDTVDQESRLLKALPGKLLSKGKALAALTKVETMFKSYDKDKDGMLSRQEITNLAKGEFKFDMPKESLDMIFQAMVEDKAKGVKIADYQRLFCAIGVAREEAQDRLRKEAREKKESEIAEAKAGLQAKLDAVSAELKAANTAVTEVTTSVRSLPPALKEKKSDDLKKAIDESEALATKTADLIEAAAKSLTELSSVEPMENLSLWFKSESTKMEKTKGNLKNLLEKAKAQCQHYSEEHAKLLATEVRGLCDKALKAVRASLIKKKISSEELFTQLSKGKDGVSKVAFFEYLKSLEQAEEDKLTDAELERVFAWFDEDKASAISKETFEAVARNVMRVVKDVSLTEGQGVSDGGSIRRLVVGECLEVLEGPIEENNLHRIRCKVIGEEKEGWVTVKGNQGSVFVKEGGNNYKVVKETILTENFELDTKSDKKSKEVTRKLKPGELLEVRQFSKKSSTGMTRMKCRAMSDGMVGWVTTVGTSGTKFLEAI
mmetsp:Transcript_39347/g.83859  ORF Transcript_39347/g.83859 Transcript_39347/m.83859 type:complete len:928 (-) Transcript_39347:89-2872(-)